MTVKTQLFFSFVVVTLMECAAHGVHEVSPSPSPIRPSSPSLSPSAPSTQPAVEVGAASKKSPQSSDMPDPSTDLLTASQKIEVGEGIRALRKMASITKTGVDRREYASRVLDMAATVDESVRNIPDSRLKESMLAAKDAYVAARDQWPSALSSIPEDLQRKFLQLAWGSAEIFVKNAEDLFQSGRLNRESVSVHRGTNS